MNAAAICLPYLFPKLSEMRIDSKSTVTHVDAGQLLDKLNERIEKLSTSPPRMIEPVIDAEPDAADEGGAGGGEPVADD
jgi:hypothetical protein